MRQKIYLFALFLILGSVVQLYAAATGKIVGTVRDAATGDALPGANVYLAGTAIGAATDLKANYQILRVPPGRCQRAFLCIAQKPALL